MSDLLALVEQAKRDHMALHDRVRGAFVGRRVIVKPAVNGIKNRSGVIADLILTYDVSLGIDLDRLDGRPGHLDRLWFGLRRVEVLPSPPEAT